MAGASIAERDWIKPWRSYPRGAYPRVYSEEVKTPDSISKECLHPLGSGGADGVDAPSVRSRSPEFHHLAVEQDGASGAGRSHNSPIWWTPEILSLLLGIASLAVIAIVLVRTDGNAPPQWPLGITLNTFVAFFTSLAKMSFMLPIVEGLSQLKWMWFMSSRPRPLIDFQIFDDASRGAFGSLKLLVRFKGFLACLAAVITLSGFLTSTITQQAIAYSVIPAESTNGTASVARATSFSLYDGDSLVIGPHDTTREKLALLNGAFYSPNETVPHVSPMCSSGECQWPLYGTLAVCGDIVNLTAAGNATLLAELTNMTSARIEGIFNSTTSMMLGLHYKLDAVPASFPIILGPTPRPTGAFDDSVTELIMTDHYIAYSDTIFYNGSAENLSKLQFLEIAFYWCTKTVSTEVKDGVHTTQEVSSSARAVSHSPYSFNFGWNEDIYPCYMAGTCNATFGGLEIELAAPDQAAQTEKYTVDVWTSLVASALIYGSMYDAALIDSYRGLVASSGGGMAQAFAPSLFGDFMTTKLPSPEQQMRDLKSITRNMGQSITNLLRDGDTRTMHSPETANLVGKVFTPQTFVAVHWGYIAMLAAQLFLTSLFLVATIAQTYLSRVQIMKGSPLATMSSLDPDARKALGGISDFDTLERRAKGVKVRLERGAAGAALWLSKAGGQSKVWQSAVPGTGWSSKPGTLRGRSTDSSG